MLKPTKWFTIKDMLWLPQWKRLATALDGLSPGVESELAKTFAILDQIRDLFDRPIIVHCAYRPKKYNELVKGAKSSAHLFGKAVDFHVVGVSCDTVRKILLPRLESLGLRMENNKGDWIHIDTRAPGPEGRYFDPQF